MGNPIDTMVERARRLRRRGDERKAIALLREACAMDEWRGPIHALLGAWLASAGQAAEAAQRIRHAQWLFRRSGEERRARALDALRARLDALAA